MTDPSGNRVYSFKALEVILRIGIVLLKLSHDILADVAIIFLDTGSNLQLFFCGNRCGVATFSQHVKNMACNVPPRNRDVLDSATDYVAVCAGNNVRNTIT